MEKSLSNKFNDKSGRVLIMEVKIENEILLSITLYNANTKNEKLSSLSDLSNMLEKIDDINDKSIIFGGYSNLFLEAKSEAQGRNPVLRLRLEIQTRNVMLFVNNALLVIFKEDEIIFHI